jgi:hypothetical protein
MTKPPRLGELRGVSPARTAAPLRRLRVRRCHDRAIHLLCPLASGHGWPRDGFAATDHSVTSEALADWHRFRHQVGGPPRITTLWRGVPKAHLEGVRIPTLRPEDVSLSTGRGRQVWTTVAPGGPYPIVVAQVGGMDEPDRGLGVMDTRPGIVRGPGGCERRGLSFPPLVQTAAATARSARESSGPEPGRLPENDRCWSPVPAEQEPSGAQTPGPPITPGWSGQQLSPGSHGRYVPVAQAQPAPV